LMLAGCSKAPQQSVQAANPANTVTTPDATATAAAPEPAVLTLPAGTKFRVRLQNTLDTRRSRAGDAFTAALDEPLVDGKRVVVPKGTSFKGHITESRPSGRFKGRAVLAVRLDSFTLDNREYNVATSSSARVSKGHKKHHFAWIGGGSGAGAVIGALA